MDDELQHGKYDPHRLIFHMCLVGVSICAIGISISLIAFFQQLGWDIFTLHVDALGDYLRSPLAFLFNVCLMLAGACFVLAMYGLHLVRYDRITSLLAASGALCGITVMLLGAYPFNDQPIHYMIMTGFICTSMLMFGVLFIYHFSRPHLCPGFLGVISFMGIIASILLLWEWELEPNRTSTLCQNVGFCYLAFLMWLHTFLTMLVAFGLAIMARRLVAATAH
ncbi:MAG: hypothetical protein LPD71_06885 [Shewanella sp.]|nr:hypothetical protein [Shewanella sp.]MCF1431603.1 hypothetical protein [Shewanella sp.]MCF1438468.1 hypothetical protein [Shewanella sp.]MCF1457907.1 hypothetical protein [Shewanella sp.]